jgi:hypothetical protein
LKAGRGKPKCGAVGERLNEVLTAAFLVAGLSVSSFAGLSFATAEPAWACHEPKEQIFVGAWDTGTGYWRTGAYGVKNKIRLKRRDMCGSSTIETKQVWSMSHLRMGGIDGNWVEVGWTEERTLTNNKFYWFSEWGLNYTDMGGTAASHPCPVVDQYDWWRTANDAGTTNWKLSINCSNDQFSGSWQLLDTFNGLGFSKGVPMGETGRRGGEATGMSEYMPELERKTSGGSWLAWDRPKCYHDNASNWQFSYIYIGSYENIQGSNNCDNRI